MSSARHQLTRPRADNIEALLLVRAELEAERKLTAAVKADPIRFYLPHPKQDQFHKAGEQRRRAVFAGNRFGKSHLGAAEDGAWLRGERVWYKENDPARRAGIPQRPVKGLVIVADWDKVREIWTEREGVKPGKIWATLPNGFVTRSTKSNAGVIDTIICANGSVLRFDTVKSYASNPLGTESSDWDFIHVDEPCPEKMFTAAARGLVDRMGSAWFTLTALTEPWIVDYFHDNNYWHIYGSIYDNPTLGAEAIEEFAALLDEDEKQCRLFGLPLHMAGLVYKQFSRELHVLNELPLGWSSFVQPPRDYTIHVRIDTHPQTPHAVLFCAVSPDGQRFYYDELYAQLSISALTVEIKKRLQGYVTGSVKVEPAAWVLDPITKSTSVAQQFSLNGLPIQRAVKDLSNGIMVVKQALGEVPPRIHFSPELKRTLWEIGRYSWKPDGSNRPVDKDDHMMENLYRMEIARPAWVDPEDEFVQNEGLERRRVSLSSLSTSDLDGELSSDDTILELAI